MQNAVEHLSDVIEAVHRSRDPHADSRLLERIKLSGKRHRRALQCQLPRDAVHLMDEIIFSERGYRPAYRKSYGTITWARWWLMKLYVSREVTQ